LEREGVRYAFGVPGKETEDLLFLLAQSSVRTSPPSFLTATIMD
jgi:hypothetical protein